MKILFLDFDGVLNNDAWFRQMKNHGLVEPTASHRELDPKNVEVINEVCRLVDDLKIVISSTWRIGNSLEELKEILTKAGFKYSDRVIGVTPCHARGPRGNEIQEWLDDHKSVKDFVILDDDEDMAHLSCRLVRTRFRYGLKMDGHLIPILKKLDTYQ